jgi:hypothetical protein
MAESHDTVPVPYEENNQDDDALSIASSDMSMSDSGSSNDSELSFESESEDGDLSESEQSEEDGASDDESEQSGEAPTASKSAPTKSKMSLMQFYDMHARSRVTVSQDHPYQIKVYRRKPGASGPRRSYQLVSTNGDGKGLYKMISRHQASELGYPKNSAFA